MLFGEIPKNRSSVTEVREIRWPTDYSVENISWYKIGLFGPRYAIRRVSEKSILGGLTHPTAVISINSKIFSQREPPLRPIIIVTWSDLNGIENMCIS